MYPITVVNRHHPEHTYPHGETIYVGRPSILGNPFPLGNYASRDACVEDYRIYIVEQLLMKNEKIINELQNLHDLAMDHPINLQCYCAPLKCHAHVIKDILESRL